MTLTPYEHLLRLYARFQEGYSWTVQDIDNTDMDFLLDQLCVLEKLEAAKDTAYIDDVL